MFNVLIHFFQRHRLRISPTPAKTILFVVALVWFSTSGYLYFEMRAKPDLKWADALWWTLVTMTTVGYGDYFPESGPGRYLVGIPTMILGIGLLGFVLSEVASKLIESKSRRLKGMVELQLSDHVIVVNYSNLEKLAKLIDELKSDPVSKSKAVVLIDEFLEELPYELDKRGIHYVRGNPTTEPVLKRAGLAAASHAIVLSLDPVDPRSDERNLATILMIEHLNPRVTTVAECVDLEKRPQFHAAGCDRLVCIAPLTTNLLVQELTDPGIQHIITEMTSNVFGQQIYMVAIEQMDKWTAGELNAWSQASGFVLLGLQRGEATLLNCDPGVAVKREDRAVLLGSRRPDAISTV
jgi:voltage-gated potassium channel